MPCNADLLSSNNGSCLLVSQTMHMAISNPDDPIVTSISWPIDISMPSLEPHPLQTPHRVPCALLCVQPLN